VISRYWLVLLGDTGGAVAMDFICDGVNVVILYPSGKVSSVGFAVDDTGRKYFSDRN